MPTLYAALDDRVLVVGDAVDDALVGYDLECVAAHPEAPDRAFAGTVDAGLRRTTDGGDSWNLALDVDARVTAVTVSPHDATVVWAGTEPSAVYRSTDGGETWAERPGLTDLDSESRWSFPPRPHTHHVRWLEVDPSDPDRLYVAIEAGALVRTEDAGETWIDHPSGARRDNHTLATHPDAPGRVYTAAGDGYAESTDGGDTWTYPQQGLDHRYVWGLAVGENPDDVVVSSANGPRSAHSPDGTAYVYRKAGARASEASAGAGDERSESAGEEWEVAMDGLPGPEGTARPVLAYRDRFYALSNHGVYASEAGYAWDPLDLAWSSAYREQVPRGLAVAEP